MQDFFYLLFGPLRLSDIHASFKNWEKFALLTTDVALQEVAEIEESFGQSLLLPQTCDLPTDLLMLLDKILNHLLALGCARINDGKEDLFFSAKVALEVFGKKILYLFGPLLESLPSHRLDLTQGLLAAPQRQSQPLVMVMRKGYQTRMSHR